MKAPFSSKIFDRFDYLLFGCAMLILVLGLLNLYSATFELPQGRYFQRQLLWALIGLVVAFVTLFFDYRLLERMAYPIYVLLVGFLALVLFMGKEALGAQRWIHIGSLSVQPSELVKPAIAFVLARHLHDRIGRALGLREVLWSGLLTAVPVAFILEQPDLGTAIIVASVGVSIVLFAGVERRFLVAGVLAFVVAVPMVWKFGLHDYQRGRVYTFLKPEQDELGKGYQIIQSKIAVGSGQLAGKGFTKGSQSKLQFLPKQHTDFIFSNFAEEWGFLGSAFVLMLYASLCLLGLNVANNARDRFGMILAFGLTALVASQAVINLSMEIGLLPVVGVPLPLFSYGGTSLFTTLICVGILLNISMRRYLF